MDSEIVGTFLLRKEFDVKLQESKLELGKLGEKLTKQEQQFQSILEDQTKKFAAKMEDLTKSIESAVSNGNSAVAMVKQSLEEQGKGFEQKLMVVSEGVHKLEIPVALNTENIGSFKPRLDTLESQSKVIPVTQSKLENLENSTFTKFSQVKWID